MRVGVRLYCRPISSSWFGELLDEVLTLQPDRENVREEVVQIDTEHVVPNQVVVHRQPREGRQLEASALDERLARNDDDVLPGERARRVLSLGTANLLFYFAGGRFLGPRLGAVSRGRRVRVGRLLVVRCRCRVATSAGRRRVCGGRSARLAAPLLCVPRGSPADDGNPDEEADGRSLHDPSLLFRVESRRAENCSRREQEQMPDKQQKPEKFRRLRAQLRISRTISCGNFSKQLKPFFARR